jgi:hypothetical protein
MMIGLSGYSGSGKDEVAKILVDKYGFSKVAFADIIKKMLYQVNPLIKGEIRLQELVDKDGWDITKKDPEVRRLLQALGLSGRELFHEGLWILQVMQPLHADMDVVITDVRFKNEASMIKRMWNAQIWRVTRPGVEAVNDHISEHDLDDWSFDGHVDNSSDLEGLALGVSYCLRYARESHLWNQVAIKKEQNASN